MPATVCNYTSAVTLTGSPASGTFTGAGIAGNVFTPSSATLGNNNITYSFTDSAGCSNSQTQVIFVSVCTGLSETANGDYGLTIFPNPAFKQIVVSSNSSIRYIEIENALGQSVYSAAPVKIRQQQELKIDVSSFADGIYFIKAQTEKGSVIKKFVKE